jgi:hypothetical protein
MSDEQKQVLASAWEAFKKPTGTSLLAQNTNYFLVSVERTGVNQSHAEIMKASEKAISGVQFASLVGDVGFQTAALQVRNAASIAAERLIAASETREQLEAHASRFTQL